MTDKVFAPDIRRNQRGWYQFPKDVVWRRSLFPQEVFNHPAKANMYLQRALIDYCTEEGDTFIDPFGGTGTAMLGLLMNRNVILAELEPVFQKMIESVLAKWLEEKPAGWTGENKLTLLRGDCRLVLEQIPGLADAAIFSPPYSTTLSHTTAIKEQKQVLDDYAIKGHALNLGRLNPFYFASAMRKVYQKLALRLVPGAPMAIITKDIMKGPVRQMLSEKLIREASRCGFKFEEWFKWQPPGSMQQSIMRAKGANVVDDEDIIIFRKKG